MTDASECDIRFVRLTDVSLDEIRTHMNDDRVARHMPLIKRKWSRNTVAEFVAAKEERWRHDGLGHWGILRNDAYVGWGGFQKEGDEWDYGLVLKPEYFGLGMRIFRMAIRFAIADPRISFVTLRLPPSRKHLRGLGRLGAVFVEETELDGARFLKYRLETE